MLFRKVPQFLSKINVSQFDLKSIPHCFKNVPYFPLPPSPPLQKKRKNTTTQKQKKLERFAIGTKFTI